MPRETGGETSERQETFLQRLRSTCTTSLKKDSVETLLALADQGIVSFASFVTTILIGRLCGTQELGVYTLAISIAFFFVAVQDSLVTMPYTVYGNRLQGHARRRYAGSMLMHGVGLTATAVRV